MLRSLTMTLLLLVACGDPSAPATETAALSLGLEAPDYTPTGGVGSPCRTDADCADADLTCDLSLPGTSGLGLCTATCTDDADAAAEAEVCGGEESTCLAWQVEGEGFCTLACDVDAEPGTEGACAAHQVCTGHGLWRETDTAGCLPFCHDDTGCGPYAACDTRTGTCVALVGADRSALLPDGSPCNPRLYDDEGRSPECQGSCISVSSNGALCASFIDLAVTTTCPDDPERILPGALRGDNYAICAFASCADDDACVEGTTCESCPFGGRCCMP